MKDSDTQSSAGAEEVTIVGEPREEADELHEAPGPWIGRYVPLRRVGRGAFGAVYAAYDPQLDRKIALKVLRAERQTPHNRLRLLREARALAAVSHPNVVAVFDVGEREDGGAIHIAMEYVEGTSLRKWLDEHRRSPRKVLAALIAIARGLEAAHAAGLAHRDIKPDNVMVTANGTPKIVDFGLARAGRSESEDGSGEKAALVLVELTSTGHAVGTPAYMAPEQHEGLRGDAKSDQFSFCVLAYEAFAGTRPFAGASVDELRVNVFAGRVVPPPRGSMPRWLWPVLQRGLAVEADRRHASMTELLDEIARRRRRPRRLAIGLGIAAVVTPAIVGAAIGSTPPCAAVGDEIDAAWNADARTRVSEVFARARPDHGSTTAERVIAIADDFATRWKAGMTESCEATRVRETQSDELFDMRAVCYREGLSSFVETVRLWQEGEATVVDHALPAATQLPRPEACARVRALRQLQPRPEDPVAAAEIEAIESEVSRARAQWRSGQTPTDVEALVARAIAVGYRPLQARVQLLAGDVVRTREREAPAVYHEALTAAIAGGDTRLAVDAGLRQCTYHRVLHDLERAKEACDLVEALIDASVDGEFDEKRLALEVLRAELLLGNGRIDEARERLVDVRARAQDQGADDAYFDATSALARTEQSRGRLQSTLALMEETKALSVELYGPLHPNTLHAEADCAAILLEVGRNEEARDRLVVLIDELERSLGSAESMHLWQAYIHLASAQKGLGDPKAALESAEFARRVLGDGEGEERALCYVLVNRGLIAYEAGEKERAWASLAEAEACLDAHPDRMSPDEAAVLLGQIGWVHEEEKHAETAISYYRRVEEYLEGARDVDPAKLVVVHAAQASLLHDLGRLEDARGKARDAFGIAATRPMDARPFVREVMDHLQETLDKVGLHEEASAVRALVPSELP